MLLKVATGVDNSLLPPAAAHHFNERFSKKETSCKKKEAKKGTWPSASAVHMDPPEFESPLTINNSRSNLLLIPVFVAGCQGDNTAGSTSSEPHYPPKLVLGFCNLATSESKLVLGCFWPLLFGIIFFDHHLNIRNATTTAAA